MDDLPTTRRSLLLRLHDPANAAAWNEFVSLYEPLVYRVARQKGLQDADARDLCQEVLRIVARAIEGWDPDPARGTFRGWLYRIARNATINHLASERRHPRGTGDSDVHRLLTEQPDRGAETALFDVEYRRQLFRWAAQDVRDQFAPATWQAFWMTGVEDKPVKEVAAELGMSVGAVYVARSRVLARLRERIEHANAETHEFLGGEIDGCAI